MGLRNLDNFDRVLEVAQRHAPEAHVAGGALRDLDNDRPIKDIDLFVWDESADDVESALRVHGSFKRRDIAPEYFLALDGVAGASEWWTPMGEEGVTVGLVRLFNRPTLEQNVDRFDFGVCRIAYDGKNVLRTREYRADVRSKCFTLLRSNSWDQFMLSMMRYRRLGFKYEGWPLIVPRPLPFFADFRQKIERPIEVPEEDWTK